VMARGEPLIKDRQFARRLAQLEIEILAHEATLLRCVAEEEAGLNENSITPSILKVKGTELAQRAGALVVEALGDEALPQYLEKNWLLNGENAPLAVGAVSDFLYRRSMTIYGGTNEVQRNIIAAQLLRN
jgi:alkylation response protein AidB-like acyl-CoA dehydrogenase